MSRRVPAHFAPAPPLEQDRHWPVELDRAPLREPGRKGLLDQLDTGNVGRSVEVPPNTASAVPIIGIEGDDETAQAVTITMSVAPPRAASAAPLAGLRVIQGTVQWGLGGHRTEAEFDVIHGTTFSILASSVRVLARNIAPVGPLPVSVLVGAFVGYFQKPFLPGPQLTIARGGIFPGGAIAPAASELVIIPAYASQLEVLRTGAVAYRIDFFGADGTVSTLSASVAVAAATGVAVIPIPADASIVRFVNTGAVAIASRRYIFRLAL